MSNEPPVPLTHILSGEEGNAIDVDKSPNVKEIAKVFGPIGDPTAKRSKRLRGYNSELTSGVKKHRINMAEEEASLEYSSTSYIPSSDNEEISHLLVKRDVGPSAMIAPSSPVVENPQVAAPPVSSPAHSLICEHAPLDDNSDDFQGVNSSMTLAAFLADFKSTTFQPEPLQQESS